MRWKKKQKKAINKRKKLDKTKKIEKWAENWEGKNKWNLQKWNEEKKNDQNESEFKISAKMKLKNVLRGA